ncbi:MAG: coagulation factor 5/8 type domain protein [Sphingomonas bacterium]|uniref:glycosyl hydrolase family 28-related protein n=1 Tax=Sphingomonas bacterium TaxID=1895847 RepID=UPI002608F9DC|nr:glycosyl hydrolase family 28-related protein [Sphingomonas bacterium]MDB5707152.1 coagulation factor 5/8 type domain protein [Sphingomonas bacterium]
MPPPCPVTLIQAPRLMRATLALAPMLAALAPVSAQQAPTPATIAALPPERSAGRGAAMPFVTLEAEDGRFDGTRLGPDRTFGTLASEASGRVAVRLEKGQRLDFVLPVPADALTLRYALPDSADGTGRRGAIGLRVGGKRLATIALGSRHAWYYGAYPFSNRPADGRAQHFYDHVRTRIGRTLPAGTRVTLANEGADWIAVDLADVEIVPPPLTRPAGARSVLASGADPTGRRSSLAAFRTAIARGGIVWIPPGTYRIDGHLTVDRVTLAGAGHWHSILAGAGIGIFGKPAPEGSHQVRLRGFAILGEVAERVDSAPLQAIGGAMNDSVIEDLWIQHTKVGLWMSGPMHGLTIRRLRVYDQAADGVNFHGGVTGSSVEDSFFRNMGDDGLAMWSEHHENAGNAFRRNTVIAPVLANGIAIYGGRDIAVENNLVADIVTQGGGLHAGTRFGATPFAGTIAFRGNMVARGGVLDPNWKFGVGAFWVYALDHPIADARIELTDTLLADSSYEAVQMIGKEIRGVTIDRLTIAGAGTAAFQLQAPGAATVTHTRATGLGGPGVLGAEGGFVLTDGGGNNGWESRGPLP